MMSPGVELLCSRCFPSSFGGKPFGDGGGARGGCLGTGALLSFLPVGINPIGQHAMSDPHSDDTGGKKEPESPQKQGAGSDNTSTLAHVLRDIAPYLDLGWRLAGAAAFPPLIGAFIDVQFQTAPWGVLTGSLIGIVGAALQLRRIQQDFPT